MRFTVVWTHGARDELARIWLAATDRSAVTAAANAIDTLLASNPANTGIDLTEGLRALAEPPLRVLFSVREADRLVEVVSIKRI